MINLSVSKLPRRIAGLNDLAYNLWWSWHAEARDLFKSLDVILWKSLGHNPVKLLQQINAYKLVAAAENPAFLRQYDNVMSVFKKDTSSGLTWFGTAYPDLSERIIAYFSPEFAIHNSLPIYAGGLGVLAGDYCKEASDIGLPLIGIGFMYPKGYFKQRITSDGWQEEVYDNISFHESPIALVTDKKGKAVTITVPIDHRSVDIMIWRVNVGRVKLYLMDTNVETNSPVDRQLSARLYAGDRELRLQQEIILGVGGVRTLRTLGINPAAWHANEGHVSFMMLERIREMVNEGIDFNQALEKVRETTVFTTHTPVPAGNDIFSLDLIDKYYHSYWESSGLSKDDILKLGISNNDNSGFNMTVLSLNTASHCNGVSKLHGGVCRQMWHCQWPDEDEKDVPIGYVTNGVHVPTWISPVITKIYNKYLDSDWFENHDQPAVWEKVFNIPDEELWDARRWLKNKLIGYMQNRARRRWCEDHVKSAQAIAMGGLFDPEVLTLGFCRRFTEYKRASMIFSDIERLKRLMHNELRPMQIVFAGKAHPNDGAGKHLIREVYNMATDPQFGGRIAFVEDYDLHTSRYLVQGVDVWLNTPRMLQEASGTSGLKASLNGVIHLSVLDGWWYEGYNGLNGWAIQSENDCTDPADEDRMEADSLYCLLEEKVVPLFYERDITGISHGWMKMVKETIRSNTAFFSARRMAKEYTEQMYMPALLSKTLAANRR